jgi:hypothetical protein
MHVALLVLALAAVDQAPPSPSPDPADQQVERVRAALERPPSRLTVPEVHADFRVHIEVRRPLQDIFDKPPWQLPPIGWRPPAVAYTAFGGIPMLNLDLMAVGGAIARGVSDARHARALRDASEEVRRSIAEYCAVQPDAATITICSSSASAR